MKTLAFALLMALTFIAVSARADEPAPAPSPSAEPDPMSGVFLSYTPLYHAQLIRSDRLNAGNLATYEAGFEMKHHGKVNFRYSRASVPALEVYDADSFTTNYASNASLSIYEISIGGDSPLNERYGKFGPVQLYVPIYFGPAYSRVGDDTTHYSALTLDAALGIGAHISTGTRFRADLSALYHLCYPLSVFWGGSNSHLLDPAGEKIRAGLDGIELRIGITYLLNGDPS